jgi:predicted restriction endonuclease
MRNFNDPNYKEWRKQVYKRDNHKCQWPGCNSNKKLNAHHIKTWSEFPSLRFIIDNGITLCYKHHKMIRGLESYYEAVFISIARKNKEFNE